MQTNKLEKAMNEINDFIKVRMNILLGDLIVQSEEYEDTKRRILQLPFIQQIINEQLTSIQPPEDSKPLADDNEEHIFLNIEEHIKAEESELVEPEESGASGFGATGETGAIWFSETGATEVDQEQEQEQPELDEETDEDSSDGEQDTVVLEPVEEECSEEEEVSVDGEQDSVVLEPAQEKELEPVVQDTVVEEEPVQEKEKESGEEEVDEDEDEEEGVFEIDINNVTYYTTDEANGDIYEITQDGEPGNQVGRFIDGSPIFDKT